jgi:hypothetical protein
MGIGTTYRVPPGPDRTRNASGYSRIWGERAEGAEGLPLGARQASRDASASECICVTPSAASRSRSRFPAEA